MPAPVLAPDPSRIGRPAGDVARDAAPDWVAGGTPEPLRGELVALLGEDRVLARASDLVRYASDASPYRKFPKAVVMAHDAGDVAKVLAHARRTGRQIARIRVGDHPQRMRTGVIRSRYVRGNG